MKTKTICVIALVMAVGIGPVADAAAHPHKKAVKRARAILNRAYYPYYYTGSYGYAPYYYARPKSVKSYGVYAGPGGLGFYYSRGYAYRPYYYW